MLKKCYFCVFFADLVIMKYDKLIVGLGNPGSKYENTRHNVGRMAIDKIAEKFDAEWQPETGIYLKAEFKTKGKQFLLCKPDTYMNNSGEAVKKIADKYSVNPNDIIIIVDEYNFPLGRIQLKQSGSDGGHNGTASIINELKDENFWRLRCGIGNDFGPNGLVDYVLSDFPLTQKQILDDMLNKITSAVTHFMGHPNFKKAASEINSELIWTEKEGLPKIENKREVRKVTVFAASSHDVSDKYFHAANELGHILANNNIAVVYGGGKVGLMGALADSILDNKGKIIGIIPEFLMEKELGHSGITHLIKVKNMAERKAKLIEGSDAIVTLPGGCGTLDELFEVITLKQLGKYKKPIIIVNIDGFYNSLIEMLNKSIDEGFMDKNHRNLWTVVDSISEILDAISQSMTL